jgi:hypothetical protein
MTMNETEGRVDLVTAGREVIDRAVVIFADAEDQALADLLRDVDFEPLPREQAQRFYERVLGAIREFETGPLDDAGRDVLAATVRREVDELLDERGGLEDASQGAFELVGRDGLPVRQVVPTQEFNAAPVPLTEGFADLGTLRLWPDNPRAELYVREFADRNGGRAPDREELLGLMTGQIQLPGATKLPGGTKSDPFNLKPLARSIGRKGVERPIIVTFDGLILDGNRRFSGSMLVLGDTRAFTLQERERSRWIRVWRLDEGATENQKDAIVVARNFEPELKEPWPEYVKARRVVTAYREAREARGQVFTSQSQNETKDEVAKDFAIERKDVTRYLFMVQWADDFKDYNSGRDRDAGEVDHKTNAIFQWFYEIGAGKAADKITHQIEADETVREIVYDLMFDVLDSGAQVRSLYQVHADEKAWEKLVAAHHSLRTDPDARRDDILGDVEDAIDEAKTRLKEKARAKGGFDEFLRTAVERFGTASPDDWSKIEDNLLRDALRVCRAATGTIEGALGIPSGPVAED